MSALTANYHASLLFRGYRCVGSIDDCEGGPDLPLTAGAAASFDAEDDPGGFTRSKIRSGGVVVQKRPRDFPPIELENTFKLPRGGGPFAVGLPLPGLCRPPAEQIGLRGGGPIGDHEGRAGPGAVADHANGSGDLTIDVGDGPRLRTCKRLVEGGFDRRESIGKECGIHVASWIENDGRYVAQGVGRRASPTAAPGNIARRGEVNQACGGSRLDREIRSAGHALRDDGQSGKDGRSGARDNRSQRGIVVARRAVGAHGPTNQGRGSKNKVIIIVSAHAAAE